MVHLGIANSRMKDFFDVWFLAQTFAFDGTVLNAAIRATFERRDTPPSGAATSSADPSIRDRCGEDGPMAGFHWAEPPREERRHDSRNRRGDDRGVHPGAA